MANRAVVVDLLVRTNQFTAGMRRASHDMASETTNMETKTRALGMQIGLLGVGMVAFAAIAVKKWADFDQAMTRTVAVSEEAGKRIRELNDAAKSDEVIRLGYSALTASDSIYELTKAGVSVTDIIGGAMSGALSLAAVEAMDAGEAASIMASALKQFGLVGTDSAHVADLLAAGAAKAQGSAHELGFALKQSGLVANQFGMSIEETTGTLALFASAGLIGSDAGTSLRTMLLHLAGPSTKAARLMEEIGLEVYGANGEMVDMETLADNLQASMGKLGEEQRNQALATIFGADATRAASLLYREGGDAVEEWIGKVDDAGFATEAAAKMMDTLNGDVTKMGATWERAMIEMGESADAPLRKLVQGFTGLIDWFGALDPAIQGVIMAITGGGGLVILAVLGIGQIASALGTLQAGLVATGVVTQATATKMTIALGRVTKAIGLASAALAIFAIAGQLAGTALDDLPSVGETTREIQILGGAGSKSAEEIRAAKDALEELYSLQGSGGAGVRGLSDAIDMMSEGGFIKAMDTLASLGGIFDSNQSIATGVLGQFDAAITTMAQSGAVEDVAAAMEYFNEQAVLAGQSPEEALKLLPTYSEHLLAVENAQTDAAGSADVLGGAFEELGVSTDAVTAAEVAAQKAHDEYVASIVDSFTSFFGLGDVYQGVIDGQKAIATSAAEESESTKDSWEDYYDGFTVTTTQLIEEMERQVVAQEEWAANITALTARMKDELPGNLQAAAQEMINEFRDLGPEGAAHIALMRTMSETELEAYVELFRRQGQATGEAFAEEVEAVETPEVKIDTEEAMRLALEARARFDGLGRPITTKLTFKIEGYAEARAAYDGLGRPISSRTGSGGDFAGGGGISGPGTGTSDSIPALLSNGEHVLTASDVQKAGGQDAVYRMRSAIQSGILKFAGGGAVGGAQINAWYERYLGRGAAPWEQSLWAGKDPAEAEAGIRDSVEGLTQSVKGWYEQYLKRPASSAEAAQWAGAGIGASDVQWLIQNSSEAKNAAMYGTRDAYAQDIQRGDLQDSMTGSESGALSAIDRARSNVLDNLTGSTAEALSAALDQAEQAASGLFDQMDAVDGALESATDQARELRSISDGVAKDLINGFSLDKITQSATVNPFTGAVTGGGGAGQGMLRSAQGYAAKVKTFAGRLQALADKGFTGVILQEVAAMGAEAGIPAADALLGLTLTDTNALNQAYADIANFGGAAGQAVTEGFYAGGVAAADGLVAGILANKDQVQAAIAEMALAMQEALKTALGIHSPSRKFRALMSFVGQGVSLGLDDQQGVVADASARLFSGVTVPGGGGFYGSSGSASGASGEVTAMLSDEQIQVLARAFETGNVRNINRATAQKNRKMELTYGARGR